MTQTDDVGGAGETADLQFERTDAEHGDSTPAAVQCASCSKELDTYYAVGEQPLCAECKDDLVGELEARTRPSRFARALLYGLPAAAVGSGIYYAILAITDYEIGLVAVLIGFMVGAAVKKGSGPGGGRRYQLLAAFLTYGAIVTTYIPFVLEAIAENADAENAAAEAEMASLDASGDPSESPEATAADPVPVEEAPVTTVDVVIALVFVVAIAFVAPFLAGFENIIGILIIGFGVYQAWRMNKRPDIEVTGPHAVAAPVAGGA